MQKTPLSRIVYLCFALAFAGALVSLPTLSQHAQAAQSTNNGAEMFVQSLGDKAIQIVADKGLTPEQRDRNYHQILRESFDLPTIGRFVIGRAWNNATPDQQREYMSLFAGLVVKIYGDKLSFYSGESFRVTGSRPEGEKDAVVSAEVAHPDGKPPTKIDWRVRQKGGKFAILDVVVEGISQSVTQRQEYASIIQRNDGKIEALLNDMRTKLGGRSP